MKELVAYFSASGVTAEAARRLAESAGADLYEIKPVVPYTDADLNWMDSHSRSTIEMKDKNSRPEIITGDLDISCYDRVYLGFPVWWYVAPTIINTFLESYDFKGKKIIIFATSGGSSLGRAKEYLEKSAPQSDIAEGGMLNSISENKLKEIINLGRN